MSNPIEEQISEMKSPDTFDARAAITGALSAKGSVRLFLDAEGAFELKDLQNEIQEAEWEQRKHSAQENDSLAHGPEWQVWQEKIEALKAKQQELVNRVLASALTFHVRGVPTKLRNIIVRQWTKKHPEPKREHYPSGNEGDIQHQQASLDALNDRHRGINNEFISKSVYKVVDVQGREDTRPWSPEDIDAAFLESEVLESEYQRLLGKVNEVSLSTKLFDEVIAQDADFLSKR